MEQRNTENPMHRPQVPIPPRAETDVRKDFY